MKGTNRSECVTRSPRIGSRQAHLHAVRIGPPIFEDFTDPVCIQVSADWRR